MKNTPKMKELYSEIQKTLFYMIPEKWERIYLYASIIENINYIETGEMYFYYFPKGILKKNPINVYEVPSKFNIDDQEYMTIAERLYDLIKDLREEFKKNKVKVWSNLTISIEQTKFIAEFRYENLINSRYDNNDRHVIWRYKYLNEPVEKFTRKDRKMIQEYLMDERFKNENTYIYQENIYKVDKHNSIEYNKNRINEETNEDEKIEKILNKYQSKNDRIEKKRSGKNEENIQGKNQILNF